MRKPDDVGRRLSQAKLNAHIFRELREGNKPGVAVVIIAHKDGYFPAGSQDGQAVVHSRR